MLAADLVHRVAGGRQEVFVRGQDPAVERELDHRLRLADRRKLPVIIGVLQFLAGDVGGIFHHLEWLSVHIEDRVVARLQPDLAAALGGPPILPGIMLATREFFPEQPVFGRFPVVCGDEHAMVLTADLVEAVADSFKKILVCLHDAAVERELDHCLRLADGRELPVVIGVLQHLCGDVGGVFDHHRGPPLVVENWIVAGLEPDLAPAFGKPLVSPRIVFPAPELLPKQAILRRRPIGRIDEHGVVLTADLVDRISHGVQEILIRVEDAAVERELDHRKRLVDRGEPTFHGSALMLASLRPGARVAGRLREEIGDLHD